MLKRTTLLIFMILLILPQSLDAKRADKEVNVATVVGSAAQQTSFTQKYNEMKATGGQAYQDWVDSIMQTGSQEEAIMLGNLKNGLNADGTQMTDAEKAEAAAQQEAVKANVGFSGTSADVGAHDLSNWNIETDDDGNVIGFAEADFELKDTDGDGEISAEEREEWNKKKQEEYDQAGGPPGRVPVTPVWDDDNDGVPNEGFELFCWQCSLDDRIVLDECHQGRPGNCDNGGSCKISEICYSANETRNGTEYECHTCEHLSDCGDGIAVGYEYCDGTNYRGYDCSSLGYDGGSLGCNGECYFDYSNCDGVGPVCGDGITSGLEVCDGTNYGNYDCSSLGYDGGSLGCNSECSFDYSSCDGVGPVCGDGIVSGLEQCDGESSSSSGCDDLGFIGGTLGCNAACQFETSLCDGIQGESATDFIYGQLRGQVSIQVVEEEFLTPSSAKTTVQLTGSAAGVQATQDTISTDNLYEFTGTDDAIFTDGFESGDTSAWSSGNAGSLVLTPPVQTQIPRTAVGVVSPLQCSIGLPGTCPGTCKPDQLCMSNPAPCHICINVDKIEITYHVYVIETPAGIVVLGKNKKIDLNAIADFDASSIMGLARSKSSAMDKVKGLMGSMGANPLAMLDGSMNMSSLTNLLKQGMTDKKNEYADDCFDNFEVPDIAKQEPTTSSEMDKKQAQKNEKKGIEGGPRTTEGEQEFGIDPQQAMDLDGPIIACGKTGKEKALMVMDKSGNPIAKILQSTLKDNPRAIEDALVKARGFNQKISNFQQGGVSGLIDGLRQKATAMATKKIQDVVFGKKGDPKTQSDPNDQFFKVDSRKKTKKSPKKLSIGSGMKFGGVILGAGGDRDAGKLDLKDQWGIQRIGYLPRDNADSAWHIADGKNKNMIIAVVDSGIDLEHPDLPQYIWTNPNEIEGNGIDDDFNGLVDDIHGWNFIDYTNDLTDKRGHGTHVAGIIAAKRNNSIGIAGINPGAIIMPIKVADEEGMSDSMHLYQGIHYAINHGAHIINLSIGGIGKSEMLESALNRAREMGIFVAVASGNTGEDLGDVTPASAFNAFAVSAYDHDGEWSTISSVGPNNALLAPGEEILSLRSKDSFHKRAIKDPIRKLYARQSGTSFAAPMVSATASLMLTKNPKLTPQKIEDILLNTATEMGDEGWDGQHGAGSLNATAALKAINETNFLIIKLDRFKRNFNKKKKLDSLDVFATVRGDFDEFTVSVGKGKRAKNFKRMAGPFKSQADHAWVARIGKDNLRGSDEWIVKIDVKDKNGKIRTAQTLLEL